MKKFFKSFQYSLSEICLVDRFLIFFMIIFFAYIMICLFTGITTSQDTNPVDIVIRTSIAGIFGYFISSHFTGTTPSASSENQQQNTLPFSSNVSESISSDTIHNQIGFQKSDSNKEEFSNSPTFIKKDSVPNCPKIQVSIISVIGITSLVILIVSRFFYPITPELTALTSQLRDLLSGCIGFLISCGKISQNS